MILRRNQSWFTLDGKDPYTPAKEPYSLSQLVEEEGVEPSRSSVAVAGVSPWSLATVAVGALSRDSSLPASSVKYTRTQIVLPTSEFLSL